MKQIATEQTSAVCAKRRLPLRWGANLRLSARQLPRWFHSVEASLFESVSAAQDGRSQLAITCNIPGRAHSQAYKDNNFASTSKKVSPLNTICINTGKTAVLLRAANVLHGSVQGHCRAALQRRRSCSKHSACREGKLTLFSDWAASTTATLRPCTSHMQEAAHASHILPAYNLQHVSASLNQLREQLSAVKCQAQPRRGFSFSARASSQQHAKPLPRPVQHTPADDALFRPCEACVTAAPCAPAPNRCVPQHLLSVIVIYPCLHPNTRSLR